MAKSPNSKSKPHLFLSCFGFSGKLRRFKPLKPPAAVAGQRKRSPPAVRSTLSADRDRSNPDSDRLASGSVAPTTAYNSSNQDLAAAVSEEVKNDIIVEKIIFESCEHLNLTKKPKGESQARFSLTRKLESFRSCQFTQLGSPTTKKDQKSTNSIPTISHSLSFPPSNPTSISRVKDPLTTGIRVGLKGGNQTRKKYQSTAAGISILIFTLAIMVLWGKLCAILCTAGWIFIVTSLRSIVEEEDHKIDFIESDSYSERFMKKLVVLKGFIYRNHKKICQKNYRNGQ